MEIDNNKVDRNEFLTYGFIIRTTKENILKINDFLMEMDNCKIVFQKSSKVKMFIKEEVF